MTAHEEVFEDTKGVIRIPIIKKTRQHNGQRKGDKRTNNDRYLDFRFEEEENLIQSHKLS